MNLYQKDNIFVLWEKSLQPIALFGKWWGRMEIEEGLW
jgi:hypothetical protein